MPYPACVNWNGRQYIREGKHLRCKLPITCSECGRVHIADRRNVDRLVKQGQFTGRCQLCHAHLRGPRHGCWRGGRHLGSTGRYVFLTIAPDHPYACMMTCRHEIAEHRLVMAEEIGRPLITQEHVHHRDGNRLNNSKTNLEILSRSEHGRLTMQSRARTHKP